MINLQTSSYFDFKNQIESYHRVTNDKIDFLEIYVKRSLEEYSKINERLKNAQKQFDNYVKDVEDFNMWYSKVNIFKKLWWSIRKYDYEYLKQLKKEYDGKL